MTNIVERLRQGVTSGNPYDAEEVMDWAADKIECLREALQDLCDAWDSDDGGRLKGNITEAHAAGIAALLSLDESRHD